MGFTEFVGRHILLGRSAKQSDSRADNSVLPSNRTASTPRRRRVYNGRERDRECERGKRHVPYLHRNPESNPDDTAVSNRLSSRCGHEPLFADISECTECQLLEITSSSYEAAPSRGKRLGWSRSQNSFRTKSNMEDSSGKRGYYRQSGFRGFQTMHTPLAPSLNSLHQPKNLGGIQPDVAAENSSILNSFSGKFETGQHSSQQHKPERRFPGSSDKELPRRPHYHRSTGRIRSNLDQLVRKSKHQYSSRSVVNQIASKRNRSNVSESDLHAKANDSELVHVIELSASDCDFAYTNNPNRKSPSHPMPSLTGRRSTILKSRPPVFLSTVSPNECLSSSKQCARSGTTSSTSSNASTFSSVPSLSFHSRPLREAVAGTANGNPVIEALRSTVMTTTANVDSGPLKPLPMSHLASPPIEFFNYSKSMESRRSAQTLTLSEDSERQNEAHGVCGYYSNADLETTDPLEFPGCANLQQQHLQQGKHAFARSQTYQPQSTVIEGTLKAESKLIRRKRPPPLRTPTDDATGFACGGGGNTSGIRQIATGRGTISDPQAKFLLRSAIISIQEVGKETNTVRARGEESIALSELDESTPEPKAYAHFDLSSVNDGNSNSSTWRYSRKPSEREQELFLFEEASQSSFGDTESSCRCAARSGSISDRRSKDLPEVTEDHFVFGSDGSFNDGGFIISSEGLVEAPERIMRKTSDGVAVEGVPTSSNNMIIVKSLNEFRKSVIFKHNQAPVIMDQPSTLGRGAAGRVYLAVHEPTGNKIAVKEINVYDNDKREQLKKELQTLMNHQSRFLVRSYGAFYDGEGAVHVTLEYMDRGSLADVVLARGTVPEAVLRKIAEHCLRGLGFLHENHILHRDVKTGNILLSRKLCRAKLSDFGLARDLVEGSSVTDTFVGTFAYMSPERLHGSEYTYASDIWGLGISILECAMGKYPFEKPQSYFDIIDAAQSNPSSLLQNHVSKELVDFVRLCTHIDPKERPKARDLLSHKWIGAGKDDANALREWLDTIPKLRCEDAEVSNEFAFAMQEEVKAKIRAKAQKTYL